MTGGWGGRVARAVGAAFRRRRFEEEMTAEMADHLERRVEDLVREGLERPEAKRRARLEFGSVESAKAACRDARRLDIFDELGRNLRHALRIFSRTPGLTLAITVTLGLGIGANVAVFSFVNAALWKPLPYPDPERLVVIQTVKRSETGGEAMVLSHDGRTWETLSRHLEDLDVAAMGPSASGVNAVADGAAEYLLQQRVSTGFFRVLGVAPWIGRGFLPAEDVPGGPRVVVISHGLWQRLFDGKGEALGQMLHLRGEPYEIVGVMPEDFRTAVEADVWTPLRPTTSGEGGGSNYTILGRLEHDAVRQRVEERVRALGTSLLAGRDVDGTLGIEELQRSFGRGVQGFLFVAWATAWLVFLVSCINVAGLLLAHGNRRSREIATRMALGGGRGAILRQLLTESLTLSLLGAGVGVALGVGIIGRLRDLSSRLGLWQEVRVDGAVLVLAAGLAVLAVAVAGLLPSWQAARLDLRTVQGSVSRVVGASGSWPRRLLLVTQIAVVVALLVGAGLLVRTVQHLQARDPGFEPDGLVAATVSLQDARYEDAARAARLLEEVSERLRRQPGIQAAAAGLSLPYQRPLNMPFRFLGEDERRITNLTYVTPGYFRTLGVHLLRGRLPEDADHADAEPVAVVNRDFVRTYLRDGEALGTRIDVGGAERRIVGVVADVQQRPSWGDPEPLGSGPAVFVPVAQVDDAFMELVHRWFQPSWVVRPAAGGDAAEHIRAAVAAVDPLLPLANVRSLREVRNRTLGGQRFQAGLVSVGAIVALLLAAVGLAGLIANSISERRRELGLRMALGATAATTFRAAVRPGLLLALVGLAVGLPLSVALARVLRSFLYGISVFDPATYAAVAAVLLAIAAAASALPALRVLRLDPSRVLREE